MSGGQFDALAGLIDTNNAVLDPADAVVEQLVVAGGYFPALKFIAEQFVQQRLKQKAIPRFDQNDGAVGLPSLKSKCREQSTESTANDHHGIRWGRG